MSLPQVVYPAVLAATNAGIGWLLFRSLDRALGAALLVVGLLVFLTVVVQTVRAVGRGYPTTGLDPS
jgi:hypothetical protein